MGTFKGESPTNIASEEIVRGTAARATDEGVVTASSTTDFTGVALNDAEAGQPVMIAQTGEVAQVLLGGDVEINDTLGVDASNGRIVAITPGSGGAQVLAIGKAQEARSEGQLCRALVSISHVTLQA